MRSASDELITTNYDSLLLLGVATMDVIWPLWMISPGESTSISFTNS